MPDISELGPPGLRAFFQIADRWGLDANTQMNILDLASPTMLDRWRIQPPPLQRATLLRISYVLAIYRALQILLPIPDRADAWITKPNSAPGFGGRSAADILSSGKIEDLIFVRAYLTAEISGE